MTGTLPAETWAPRARGAREVAPGSRRPGPKWADVGRSVDPDAVRVAARALILALGYDPNSEHLARTPERVAAAYLELLTPQPFELTVFSNDEGYDELVLARGIPFTSLCEHHLLPFHGTAHVGYLPADRLVGLSKLARVVESLARDLQVQERLTRQVVRLLQERLSPRGVGVVLQAEHQCMTVRGVRAHDALTLTSAWSGELQADPAARAEFLSLAGLR